MKKRRVLRNGKNMVWEADIPPQGGMKRVRLFAPTLKLLEDKIEMHTIKTGQAASLGALDGKVYAVAMRWSGEGKLTAQDIDRACREYSARKGLMATAADAAQDYLEAPRETPFSSDYLTAINGRLERFKERFGTRQLASLTAGEINDFCRSRGRSSPDFFSTLRAVFRYAHSRELIMVNPFDRLSKPELAPPEKELLTPEQMRKLLRISAGLDPGSMKKTKKGVIAARHDSLLRMLVFGGFVGLRTAEIERLACADVDRESWETHVRKMKTQKRGIRERYAQAETVAKLWLTWLDLPPAGPVITVEERNLRLRRKAACEKAEVTDWPHNALRRSFASYHLASFGDAARTAEILGHTDAETTKSKYRVARKKEIADAWFAITPDSVFAQSPPPRQSPPS